MRKALLILCLAVGLLIACNSSPLPEAGLGSSQEALGSLAPGDASRLLGKVAKPKPANGDTPAT